MWDVEKKRIPKSEFFISIIFLTNLSTYKLTAFFFSTTYPAINLL